MMSYRWLISHLLLSTVPLVLLVVFPDRLWIGFSALVAVPVVLALVGLRGNLRNRREQVRQERYWSGRCLDCGYDLRTRHANCPECGKPVNPAADADGAR